MLRGHALICWRDIDDKPYNYGIQRMAPRRFADVAAADAKIVHAEGETDDVLVRVGRSRLGLHRGWLAFDGGRALVVGDYVTLRSGQYAGQLGPWAKVVSALGSNRDLRTNL